jgi:hypothetical protein
LPGFRAKRTPLDVLTTTMRTMNLAHARLTAPFRCRG